MSIVMPENITDPDYQLKKYIEAVVKEEVDRALKYRIDDYLHVGSKWKSKNGDGTYIYTGQFHYGHPVFHHAELNINRKISFENLKTSYEVLNDRT